MKKLHWKTFPLINCLEKYPIFCTLACVDHIFDQRLTSYSQSSHSILLNYNTLLSQHMAQVRAVK